MRRFRERISQGDIELRKVHPMQKHIYPAQVIGGEVDFLSEETFLHVFAP